MKSQTLQYYMHDGPSAFRFELAGDLNDEGARELAQAWRTASSMIGNRALFVDMTFVTSAEKDGRSLLARWHAEGAQLIARSKVSRELAEAIVGGPLPEFIAPGDAGAGRTWLPFHASFGALKPHLTLLLVALLLPMQARAANLKAETVVAWDDYVQPVSIANLDRARLGGADGGAVHGSSATSPRSAGAPASAEQLRGVSAALSTKGSAFTSVH